MNYKERIMATKDPKLINRYNNRNGVVFVKSDYNKMKLNKGKKLFFGKEINEARRTSPTATERIL